MRDRNYGSQKWKSVELKYTHFSVHYFIESTYCHYSAHSGTTAGTSLSLMDVNRTHLTAK